MEFPDLGQHCSDPLCNRLDFLPVKCDGCNKVFCTEHYSYSGHNCPEAYKKNVQVPVCPLCNAVIPGKADELPDIRVSRHIDSDCKSDVASKRKKVFTNRCSLKGCKQKELVPVKCDRCSLNYCLKHRHPQDHSCSTETGKPVSKAGLAALSRQSSNHSNSQSWSSGVGTSARNFFSNLTGSSRPSNSNPTRNVSSLQGNISEEDALRMAMEASLSNQGGANLSPTDSSPALTQEQEDFMLAKALSESEMTASSSAQNPTSSRRQPQNCDIC